MPLEMEHLTPQAVGGDDAEENLWLACRVCNGYKHTKIEPVDGVTGESVALFNPREEKWSEHFKFSPDKTAIIGLTPTGRATVIALKLNHELTVRARKNWVIAGWCRRRISEFQFDRNSCRLVKQMSETRLVVINS